MSLDSERKEISDDILMYRYDLCTNMNNFRSEGKYVDVILQCKDNVSFGCHRNILASATKYFDTMFSGDFKESKEGSIISLPETSAKTFENVLQYIYTGDVTVSSANALDILEASEFFGLSGMEKLVITFAEENRMNVKNTLELLQFAYKTQKQKLITELRFDIANTLEISSREKVFLEISFDDLISILNHSKEFCEVPDDVLLGAIIRWISHNREERVQYFAKLSTVVTDFNPPWMRYMMNLFACGLDSSSLSSQTEKHLRFYNTSETSSKVSLHYQKESRQYIYVRYAEENLMRVFSMNERDKRCFFACEVPLFESNHWMKCIASKGYLYSLHYVRRDSDYSLPSAGKQSFRVSNSINMDSMLCLKEPPTIFGDVSMCSVQNQIYVYNKTPFQCIQTANALSSGIFSVEQISHGIYIYNCELDLWFPVPEMKKKLQNSCMTSIDDRIYLIGGVPLCCNDTDYKYYAQAYDHRAGIWNALPKTTYNYVGADCCGRECFDRVYVCGGVTPAFEAYDCKAGEWIVLKRPPTQKQYHRLIFLSGKFYTMGCVTGDLSIQIFKQNIADGNIIEQWTNSSILADAAKKTPGDSTAATILDSVIFSCSIE